MDDFSLSGLQQIDPSGSTPQPAPLSGLPLPTLFGDSAGQSLAGTPAGGIGGSGQGGGPGLDFFQLLSALQGSGGGGVSDLVPPNLSSLLGSIGSGGIGAGSLGQGGGFGGFGQAGGLSQGNAASNATGGAGTSGSVDPLQLLREALGLGKSAAQAFGQGGSNPAVGGVSDPSLGDFQGSSLTNPDINAPTLGIQHGDLGGQFLSSPFITDLATSGMLTGSVIPKDLWDQFSQDPQFLAALTSGQTQDFPSNLLSDAPLGVGGSLQNPLAQSGGDAFSLGAGNIAGGLGGLQSLLGLPGAIQSGNPISILQSLYGAYQGINAAGDFGLPGLSSLLSQAPAAAEGAAGAGTAGLGAFGALAIPTTLAAIYNLFGMDTAMDRARRQPSVAQAIRGDIKNVPQVAQQIANAGVDPGVLGGLGIDQLQSILQNAQTAYDLSSGLATPLALSGKKEAGLTHPDFSSIAGPLQNAESRAFWDIPYAADLIARQGGTPNLSLPFNYLLHMTQGGAGLENRGGFNATAGWDPYYGGQPGSKVRENGERPPTPGAEWATGFGVSPENIGQIESLMSGAQPGNYLQSLNSIYSLLNPNLASTPFGQMYALYH